MQRFKRPPEPATFEKKVKKHRKSVRDCVMGANGTVSKPKFPQAWKHFKDAFSKAQQRKCGYCEGYATVGQYGDVEHYHPKGEVWKLEDDPATWGTEAAWLATVHGRKYQLISNQGYWWRAYSWDNYLLACQVCNQQWKLAHFPVAGDARALPPDEAAAEDPLLLNPFDGEEPSKHLSFDKSGQIVEKNGSVRGLATIRTCGLDRDGLRASRKEKAMLAFRLVKIITEANRPADQALIDDAYEQFREAGNLEYAHCGMVRTIFEDFIQLKWADVFGEDP